MTTHSKNSKSNVYRAKFTELPKLTLQQEKILIPHIIHIVQKYYGTKAGYEINKSRKKEDVKARHVCMYLTKNSTISTTVVKIGEYFNVKHCNIIHAYNKIADYLVYDKHIQIEINELKKQIHSKAVEIKDNNYDSSEIGEYDYINLNDFISMKIGNKYIIGVNLTQYDVETLNKTFGDYRMDRHNNTGLFLLENKNKRQNDTKN